MFLFDLSLDFYISERRQRVESKYKYYEVKTDLVTWAVQNSIEYWVVLAMYIYINITKFIERPNIS